MSTDPSAFSLRYTADGGVTVPLTSRPIVVGSGPQADFQIQSPFVSHRHLQVELRGETVYITDLGSRNGTVLNGRKLAANQPILWRPGESLSLGDVRLELSGPGALPSTPPNAASLVDPVTLTISPNALHPDKLATLTLNYTGDQERKFYLEGHTLTDGLDISVFPREVLAKPGVTTTTQARIKPTKRFWLGGTFPIRFTAFTTDGLYASAEARITLRRRYEALLLLLLLIPSGVVSAILLTPKAAPPIVVPTLTRTVTVTGTSTATQTFTDTPTSTLTSTAASTDQPTATPTLPDTVLVTNQCDTFVGQNGWQYYIVQPGDTLFKLAGANMAQVQQVNAIADTGYITVGQKICLPVLPIRTATLTAIPTSTLTPTVAPTLTATPSITSTLTFTPMPALTLTPTPSATQQLYIGARGGCRQWSDAVVIVFTLTNYGPAMTEEGKLTIKLPSGKALYADIPFKLGSKQIATYEVDAQDATLTIQNTDISTEAACQPGS